MRILALVTLAAVYWIGGYRARVDARYWKQNADFWRGAFSKALADAVTADARVIEGKE